MPKLQKSISKKTGQKKYHINIPKEIVEEKGWDGGQKFKIRYDKDGDIIFKEIK